MLRKKRKKMSKKVIVVGDLHFQSTNMCKYLQTRKFLEWLCGQETNCSENDIVLLGDVAEFNAPFSIFGELVDWFENHFKYSHIYILQGNHDISPSESLLNIFKNLKRVTVISQWCVKNIDGIKFLFCPYYHHEGKDIEPMTVLYSNLYENENCHDIDYCLHHVEDETNHYGEKFCDFSKLDAGHFLCGHIHTEDVSKGGHYLGSPIKNSSTESGKTAYIAEIDCDTKDYTLKEVPEIMEYYECEDMTEPTDIFTDLALLTVKNVINKEDSVSFYKPMEERGIYVKQFVSRKVRNEDGKSSVHNKEKTNIEYFNEYASSVKLNDDVCSLCKGVLE